MEIDINEKLNDRTSFAYKNFQEGWNMPNLENQNILHFEFQCQKL